MESNLIEMLARLALASSAALILVLLARRPLRRFAGVDAPYAAWLMVPFALVAAALPALQSAPLMLVAAASPLAGAAMAAITAPDNSDWTGPLVLAWACGAFAAMAMVMLGQRSFVRSLGTLHFRDGLFFAEHSRHGPALLGLVRPIIVVPADFTTRYTVDEQALIIAHERQHAVRRDPLANAVLALLQAVFWFNPLMHLGASRCRFDQELACDAAVMAQHANQRQAYAAAMLKTQSAGAPALATCHWQSSHPLKERIMQLKKTPVSTARRRAGHLIVALLTCSSVLGTVTARADAPAKGAETYDVAVQFGDGPGKTLARLRVKAGEDAAMRWEQAGQSWNGVFNFTPAGQSVFVKMTVTAAGGKVIMPSVLLRPGSTGRVVDDASGFQIGLTITSVLQGS